MNTICVSVKVKDNADLINLILFQKIYATPEGIVNHWATDNQSDYRLEVIIDKDDLSINPSKITKSMDILTDEWNIADQLMLELYEKGSFSAQEINPRLLTSN